MSNCQIRYALTLELLTSLVGLVFCKLGQPLGYWPWSWGCPVQQVAFSKGCPIYHSGNSSSSPRVDVFIIGSSYANIYTVPPTGYTATLIGQTMHLRGQALNIVSYCKCSDWKCDVLIWSIPPHSIISFKWLCI